MKTALAILSALAGIVSALPFLIRSWQEVQRTRARARQLKEIHDAVYSHDRARMAALLQRLRQTPRDLR